ncbi:general secretion pathway protein GspB [Hydrogenophaga sp. RWCD_12]|uniref:general secretion pathway protein GspB n=1 Tax=Hydrogenophaga sp. RWCD_12 TaxID=3391190 RepID=UPI0039848A98
MSYILDALKRAHADRSHAASAGTTQSGTQAFALPPAAGGRRLPRGLLLGAVSLIVVAALATWWLRKERAPGQAVAPSVVAVAPASPEAPGTASPPNATQGDTAPPATPKPFVGPTQSAAPVLRPPPMPANAPDRGQTPTPTPAQSAARGAALMPIQGRLVGPGDATPNAPPADGTSDATGTMAPGAPAAPGAGVPAAPPAMPVAAPNPATPAQPPVTRTTPTTNQGGQSGTLASDAGLKVTGATYSENPAHRLLIVNGKVVKEGQEVEPGLVLEVISPRSAVFKRQGTRFNVNY